MFLLGFLAMATTQIFAQEARQSPDDAWWTGPVVAYSPRSLPQGHMLIEPYLFDVSGTPEAKAFVAERLAQGASMLRDMVADAWAQSAKSQLGYGSHKMAMDDIEAGKVSGLVAELQN
jgi:hypothetical protein